MAHRKATMIRSIALALSLGALVAAGAFYATSRPSGRNFIAAWSGAPERTAETTLALEA